MRPVIGASTVANFRSSWRRASVARACATSADAVALRHRVVIHLAADRVGLDQRLEPGGLHLGPRERGFRALQGGRGRVHVGLERRRVDLEQRLAGTDFRALLEQPPLHDAADLRPDLGDPDGATRPGRSSVRSRGAGQRHRRNRGGRRGGLLFGGSPPASPPPARTRRRSRLVSDFSCGLHRRRHPAARIFGSKCACARWSFVRKDGGLMERVKDWPMGDRQAGRAGR